MSKRITVHTVDGVGVIKFDRPPLNVIDLQMQDELCAAAEDLDRAPDVSAVVLHGGENFAAGSDVKEMAEMSAADISRRPEGIQAAFNAIARISKPVIAAVTGYALGGGSELALCADVRFSAEDAVWGQPEITVGIMPGGGATQRLPRLIGPSRAKDLIFTGRRIDADEALRIGLVDRVAPSSEVLNEAIAWASRFVGGPSMALAAVKRAVDGGQSLTHDAALQLERDIIVELFETSDRKIGMTHFTEKRPGQASFEGQ